MDLNQKEIEIAISALEYKVYKMRQDMLSVRYDDHDAKIKEIDRNVVLMEKFKHAYQKAIDNGITNINPPEHIVVEKITRVEAFSETDGVNDFLIKNKDVEVISLTPFLKNHGYKEYVLLYNKLVPKDSE